MYRRLKNILGVSLMILAVILSQIPMPEAQAEETSTVTFSMNGGKFDGEYNGYNFKNQTPVLVLDNNKTIDSYPDDKYASYAGYETENGKWYVDKACIEEFDRKSSISESVTIYKKWYSTQDGFCMNPDKTVLYQYSGDTKLVQIPDSVTTIAPNAFQNIANVRGIVLPKNIETIYDNAFSGADQENSIIYIYDNESSMSSQMAQKLAESYDQFVYSSYLDVDKVEEIAGIQYDVAENQSETQAENEVEDTTEKDNQADGENAEETVTETEAQEYTVTFDTGISGIVGEKRTIPAHSTVSELVSISGEQPQILKKGSYTVETDDGKQETIYTFDGWYKDSGCTIEWNFSNDTIESDTIIYAKWNRETKPYFYVNFVAEGADNVPEQVKLYADDPLNEPSEIPSIKGKTFKGWYTDEEDSEKVFTAWGEPLSGNLTLYAQWETDGYTVTFNMNGGKYSGTYDGKEYDSVSSVKTKVEKGKGIAENAYPEHEDDAAFKYSGYTTDSNWYTDKNCLSKYSKTDSNGNAKEIKKNLTLYKKWYATTSGFTMNDKKTVLYKYNGGSSNVNIPETVTVIGGNAFSNISAIKNIALPDALTDVDEDAFSAFANVSNDVTLTAESDSAIAIAKELASKYQHLVYEENTASSDENNTTKSGSVSVLNSNDSNGITLGAAIGGSTGTSTDTTSTSSASVTLGATAAGAPVAGVTTSGIGANSVTIGETQTTASEAVAAQNSVASESNGVSSASTTKTTSKTNATAASAPSDAQHVKDSTPKTGDPVQYRMLFVYALFSAGILLVLTGNGKRRKFSPS